MEDCSHVSSISESIKLLVIAVGSTDEPVYRVSKEGRGELPFEPTWLAYYFGEVWAWQAHYLQGAGHCGYLDAFWAACRDLGLDASPLGLVAYDEGSDRYCGTEETLNWLAIRIRANLARFNVPLPAKGLSTLLCKLGLEVPVVGVILSASMGMPIGNLARKPFINGAH